MENTTTQLLDQTVVAFDSAATDQFDPQYDADKPSGNLNRQTLYSVNNGKWLAINVLHDIAQTSTVPVGLEPGSDATFDFSFIGINTFDPTSYIFLEDKFLHVMHDVRAGDYIFTADSSDAWDRFVLHFTPPAVTTIGNATCNAPGTISIAQPGNANWNYTVTDSIGNVIATGVINQNSPVQLVVLAGRYLLTLIDVNNYTVTQTLQVNGQDPLAAAFTTTGLLVLEGEDITFIASTTTGNNYQWDFGNGQTANGASVTYAYSLSGVYTTVLTVSNSFGCTATDSQTITVNAITTGQDILESGTPIRIWSNGNIVFVDLSEAVRNDIVISIYDILGQQISCERLNGDHYEKQLANIISGNLVVTVQTDNSLITRKVFIAN